MKMSESQLQVAVANYLATRYPKVLFHSDFGSGVRLTAGQAKVNSAQNAGRRGWPDLFIAERCWDEERHQLWQGLFIELKTDGTRLRKKNGEWASLHIAEQAEVLRGLRTAGYWSAFAVGFEQAKNIIDHYLDGKLYQLIEVDFRMGEVKSKIYKKFDLGDIKAVDALIPPTLIPPIGNDNEK